MISDLTKLTVSYPGGVEEHPLAEDLDRPEQQGHLFELREHTNFMPLAPGDIVVVDLENVVRGVAYLAPLYTYEVLLHLPADLKPFHTPTDEHPAMQKIAALEEEWRNAAWVTRFSNFSFYVSSQTEEWLREHVFKHPFVKSETLVRTPDFRIDFNVARENPDLDGTGGGPWL